MNTKDYLKRLSEQEYLYNANYEVLSFKNGIYKLFDRQTGEFTVISQSDLQKRIQEHLEMIEYYEGRI